MTSVVITGAAGFLGRYLTAHLESIGITVFPVSRQAFPGLLQVTDYCNCPAADVLIHLAEESDRGKANELGDGYALGTLRVVKALSTRYRKLIYASSSLVYGDENECACRIDLPVVYSDVYSHSKLQNEEIVLNARGVVARLSNLIGLGMATNNVVSDIIRQIPGRAPVQVRDDKPVRDFLHVSDAASAFGRMVRSEYRGIFNVGSGNGTSVREVAELALALTSSGQKSREIVATAPSSRNSINVLDISVTTKILDWTPAFSLRDGILQLVNDKISAD